MKVLGLVTEYNPFHNGHKYHLNKSKEITSATHTVAVMSGNFLQRGEPALLDKWVRAKMAITQGVDLVIELPIVYSCNSAEFFAKASIKLLDSLNVIDYICFGSESGSIKELNLISEILADEPQLLKKLLKEYLKEGYTFPSARHKALIKYLNLDTTKTNKNLLNFPNNILGIEYLKALKQIQSKIIPLTIKRIKSEYNSAEIRSEICSATAIRKLLESNLNKYELLANVMPSRSYEILKDEIEMGKSPIFLKDLEKIILYKLRTATLEEIARIHDVNEGLENRIKKASIVSKNIYELIDNIKTKRYTLTRIQRILIKIILGITKEDINFFEKESGPQYIRVLGFSKKGTELIRFIKQNSSLPVITNLKKYVPQNNTAKRMLEIDIISTDIYSLLFKNQNLTLGGYDYINNPYINLN